MQIVMRKVEQGFQIQSGFLRVKAAFNESDEVLVESPGIGAVLLVKLPDGRIVATQNEEAIEIFGTGTDGEPIDPSPR